MITANTGRRIKQFALFLVLSVALNGLAQAPQMINYQGMARSGNGVPKANAPIGLKFEILQNSTVVYTEVQTVTSNSLGLFTTQIGKTTPSLTVNWQGGSHFLRVGVDTAGGTMYVTLGAPQQLVSVPYALHAQSTPPPAMSYSNNVLTVNGGTVSLLSSGTNTSGSITGSTNVNVGVDLNNNYTVTVNPTLTVNGNTLSISGGNSVPMTNVTATGASTATATANGFNINTPSVTLTEGFAVGSPPLGYMLPGGLVQITGTYPNFSIAVTPTISYNSNTGVLTLSNNIGTSPYTYSFNVAPTLTLIGNVLQSGPNLVDFINITPWRQYTLAPQTTTLANNSSSVGIGVMNPTAKVHIDGFTKLGLSAPGIKMEKVIGTTSGSQGGTVAFNFSAFTTAQKILSISVMVEQTTGAYDWLHPGYTSTAGYQFDWRILGTTVEVVNVAGNSANILSKNLQILITYEQ